MWIRSLWRSPGSEERRGEEVATGSVLASPIQRARKPASPAASAPLHLLELHGAARRAHPRVRRGCRGRCPPRSSGSRRRYASCRGASRPRRGSGSCPSIRGRAGLVEENVREHVREVAESHGRRGDRARPAPIATGRAPSDETKPCTSRRSRSGGRRGRREEPRRALEELRPPGAPGPRVSAPQIGCPPMNRAGRSRPRSERAAFVEPTSVTVQASPARVEDHPRRSRREIDRRARRPPTRSMPATASARARRPARPRPALWRRRAPRRRGPSPTPPRTHRAPRGGERRPTRRSDPGPDDRKPGGTAGRSTTVT